MIDIKCLLPGLVLLVTAVGCSRVSSIEDGGTTDTDTYTDTETDTDTDTGICPDGNASAGAAGMTWIMICGGTFEMGSDTINAFTQPVHSVTVPSFEISRTEVTVAQYGECVTAGSCTEAAPYMPPEECNWNETGYENHPVNCVRGKQSLEYCTWSGGRLPTESEWEYAARGGGANIDYPWGDDEATCDYAVMWSDEGESGCGTGRTWEVCGKVKDSTSQGVCDMAGNVSERVRDQWHDSYTGAPGDGSAWVEEDEPFNVIRGGSFYSDKAVYLRAAHRYNYPWFDCGPSSGFRCVREVP